MNLKAFFAASVLALVSAGASADQVDVNLSNDTAYMKYASTLNYNGYGRTDMEIGALYTEAGDVMGSFGMFMTGEAGSDVPGLGFGLTVRLYAMNLDAPDASLAAVALGGGATYKPAPGSRFGVTAYINYAPNITTFGDAENLMETGLRAEYEVLPGAAAYVGYRLIRTELVGLGDIDLDDGGHVGLRLSF